MPLTYVLVVLMEDPNTLTIAFSHPSFDLRATDFGPEWRFRVRWGPKLQIKDV
jgi:hypothetical protein